MSEWLNIKEGASVINCNYTEKVDLTEKILVLTPEIFQNSEFGLNVILIQASLTNQPVYFGKDS
jgi:hypothetical protein